MASSTHSTTEDFYITLRYAENIAHGAGFVYNLGERVLGTTTPLYTLILALSAWMHIGPVFLGKLINIAADGGTCFLIGYLPARPEIGLPRAGQFAALLYAFSSTPVSITIGGMETGLVTCTGMAMIAAYSARSTRILYVLGALLFLLRIDGLLLFALLAACLAIQQRRIPWREVVLACLIAAPWILFAMIYFGSPIPTSLTAKVYVYSHALASPRSVTIDAFRTQFSQGVVQATLSLLFVLGVIGIMFKSVWRPNNQPQAALRASLGAPAAWLCIYYLAMYCSTVPPFPWYFLPPWPIYLIVAMLGASLLMKRFPRTLLARLKPIESTAAFAGLLVVGVFGTAHLGHIRSAVAREQLMEDSLRIPIGLWFNQHALPNERILLEPIGYIGYFSRRQVLDMIGLVSPEVFSSYRTPHPLADMVVRFRPEWLCLSPAEIESLRRGSNTLLYSEYVYVRQFNMPGRAPDFLIYHLRRRRP